MKSLLYVSLEVHFMKKIMMAILLLGLLMLAPFALAEEPADPVVDETELENLVTPAGASVRLFQLEKSIERNIIRGEEIISLGNFSSEDVALLEEQLSLLRALLNEVQEMELNDTPEELALAFVSVKREAIVISQDFRTIARNSVSEQEANHIRARVEDTVKEHLLQVRARIEEKRNEHNALQLARLQERMGLVDEDLINRVRQGDVNASEIGQQLRKQLKNISQERVRSMTQEIKEERLSRQIFGQTIAEQASQRQQNNGLQRGRT
jgi:hypothetical protein